MTKETWEQLSLPNLRPIPTVLEFPDRSTILPEGILEDIIVSFDSRKYHVYFLVLHPNKS